MSEGGDKESYLFSSQNDDGGGDELPSRLALFFVSAHLAAPEVPAAAHVDALIALRRR